MRILIVDDEPLARQRLCRLVEQIGGHTVVAEAGDGEQALALNASERPDLVLMDIRMPGRDGLSAAAALADSSNPPALIFCTAYDEYALKAFEAQAVDYLLKPVRREKLQIALSRAKRLNRAQLAALESEASATQESETGQSRQHISVNHRRGVELVPISEVRYFFADQKYTTVVYQGGEVLIEDSLRELASELGDRFVRVHRNALVALAYIQSLERDADGHYFLLLDGVERPVQVSRRHVSEIRRLVKSL